MTGALSSLPSKYILFVSVYLTFKNQPFAVTTADPQPNPQTEGVTPDSDCISRFLPQLSLVVLWDLSRVIFPPWWSL